MNTIIIVGHPSSGHEDVESWLRHAGLKSALPSRREGMLPKEITASICIAEGAPGAGVPCSESGFRTLEAGGAWQGLMLDMVLGNLNQDLWGWADSQAIFILDHLLAANPRTLFVLVYDEVHQAVLKTSLEEAGELDEDDIQRCLGNWNAYNGAMLGFFLRHAECCLLVHSRQACGSPDLLRSLIQERLDSPWDALTPEIAMNAGKSDAINHLAFTPLAASLDRAAELIKTLPPQALGTLSSRDTELHLIDNYLAAQPHHQLLYEELQAAANMPFQDRVTRESTGEVAWKALRGQRQMTSRIIDQLLDEYQNLDNSRQQIHLEHELLLIQLYQVQDELEASFLAKRNFENHASDLKNKIQWLEKQRSETRGAAERVKQQLSYRLGSTIVARSRCLSGWFRMPFALVLETIAFRRDRLRRGNHKLPPLAKYADYNQAEQVMKQLSYRIGRTLLDHVRSPIGWIRMPFAISRQISEFKKYRNSAGTPSQEPTKS